MSQSKKVCSNCTQSMPFHSCEELSNITEYCDIEKRFEAKEIGMLEFLTETNSIKSKYTCPAFESKYIEYPIEVSGINMPKRDTYCVDSEHIGKFVKIKPCDPVHKGKTYLGIYLGDLPLDIYLTYDKFDTKMINISYHNNPAIFVFDLNQIIYGCESYWGVIEDEDDFADISQNDIQNLWYVKALNAISQQDNTAEEKEIER